MKKRSEIIVIIIFAASLAVNTALLIGHRLTGSESKGSLKDSVTVINTNTKNETIFELRGKEYTQTELSDSATHWLIDRDYYKALYETYKKAYEIEFNGIDSAAALNVLLERLKAEGIDISLDVKKSGNSTSIITNVGENTNKMLRLLKYYNRGKLNIEFKGDSTIIIKK